MEVDVDCIATRIDDFMNLFLADGMKALFSVTFVFLYLNIHL